MPHIHTEPGQHDLTVSAYIVRQRKGGKWLCLVHRHKKLGWLMQPGGHVELSETPWQALEHEIREETGFRLEELSVLQPAGHPLRATGAVVHPVPMVFNTHTAGSNTHYHTDLCYGFVALAPPTHPPAAGESGDIRWLTLDELENSADEFVLRNVIEMYRAIIDCFVDEYRRVSAKVFSLKAPSDHFLEAKHNEP